MSKAKKAGRSHALAMPSLLPVQDPGLAKASAAEAWRIGAKAEADFDFETAHGAYRQAVRASHGGDARAKLLAYAQFLVERYGQFGEVAAWLNSAGFEPEVADDPTSRELTALVGRAAAETNHPRLECLDEALARRGDAAALQRVAQRHLDAGDRQAAWAVLEPHRARLLPHSAVGMLAEELHQAHQTALHAALLPVTEALLRRDIASARVALQSAAPAFGGSHRFAALRAEVDALDATLAAEAMRDELDRLLDADDLEGALAQAEALAHHAAATDSDRATRDSLAARSAETRRRAAFAAAVGLEAGAQIRALCGLHQARRDEVPASLLPLWDGIQLACSVMPVTQLANLHVGVLALVELLRADAAGDADAAEAAAKRLPAAFDALPPVAAVSERRAARAETAREAKERATWARAQAALDDGDPELAREILDTQADMRHPEARALREVADAALVRASQARKLRTDFDQAVRNGRIFAARRALQGLAGLDADSAAWAAEKAPEIEERRNRELRGTPVPPFNLKLAEGPTSVGVADGRLIVVAERLWLAINLETRGIAPFQLPDGFGFDGALPARIGSYRGRARALGSSGGRLVAIEAEVGGRPEVVQARPLIELTRGEARILSASLDPSADVLVLLVQPRGEAMASLVRVDAETFEILSSTRVKPGLSSVAAIEQVPGEVLATTTPEARRKRHDALLRLDGEARTKASFRQDDLGDWLAGVRRAIGWPEQDRVYASWTGVDPFDQERITQDPSLLVLRGDRVVFSSAELRRRFAPSAALHVDAAWTLDTANGRLWFAALPRQDAADRDALLLGVDARSLRPDHPVPLNGVERILALEPLHDGVVAFCRLQGGGHCLARALRADGDIALTIDRLPV